MKELIIVAENGDINIFPSLKRAACYLAPHDIKNFEYQIFNSKGVVVNQETYFEKSKGLFGLPGFNVEKVSLTLSDINDRPCLRKILESYLNSCEVSYLPDFSLRQLIDLVVARIGLQE